MVGVVPLLVGVLLFWMATPQLRADEGSQKILQWMGKMGHAIRALSYEGTLVYLHGNQLEAMQVVHTTAGNQERERLSSLNGDPREVVLDSDSITCVSPHSRFVSVDKRPAHLGIPSLLPGRADELGHYYEFRAEADGRVADRPTEVISIAPRDPFRYGYRIQLDKESGLPLKTDTLTPDGTPIAQIMYTHLQIDPSLAHSASAPRINAEGFTERRPPVPTIRPMQHGADRWVFADLPAGFRPSIHDVREQADGSALEHFVLSDGLASISVYIEDADEPEEAKDDHDLQGPAAIGAVNAFGHQLSGHQVTVVGEVPAATVQRVAEGMRLGNETGQP